MAESTGISWCDSTFNPWIGCSKVSAGCANCYAERDFDKRRHFAKWGPNGTRVLTSEANWKKPIKWDKDADARQQWASTYLTTDPPRPRVFCASLADIFEEWDGPILNASGRELWIDGRGIFVRGDNYQGDGRLLTMNDVRAKLFRLIDATPNLIWMLLTKRPENIAKMWPAYFPGGYIAEAGSMNQAGPRSNVWLGTSCENQEMADKRVPELLQCKGLASKLFLSCEPLLGPVDLNITVPMRASAGDRDEGGFTFWNALTGFRTHKCGGWTDNPPKKVDWVITGAESGPQARPSELAWHESIVGQCKSAGVAVFVKQLQVGGKLISDMEAFPESLRIQEFPS